nr:unnamed protein product [Spirometra erinaceieuropaei]
MLDMEEVGSGEKKDFWGYFEHTFNSFNRNGLSFIAIADASTSQQQTLNFLRLLESKYTSDPTRVLEAHSGSEHCHQIDFGRVLATEMANFSQQDQSKVMELRSKVADVSLLMQNNIVDLEKRGAKLDDLFTKTEAMESEAAMFQTTARQVKQKHYWDNCRTKIILFSALPASLNRSNASPPLHLGSPVRLARSEISISSSLFLHRRPVPPRRNRRTTTLSVLSASTTAPTPASSKEQICHCRQRLRSPRGFTSASEPLIIHRIGFSFLSDDDGDDDGGAVGGGAGAGAGGGGGGGDEFECELEA